ncbi:unnamed protein product [Psylliodes chrysocephalus]|uniref:HAT C-terminal dimerisation domain-containing protein n=1 Tax=Psylliodes chrysocephalus TaxID=3402493 RepID=A0A9P0DBS4_9CUCU|nr:unnamed protein product [Psylliodes chrysocephala]
MASPPAILENFFEDEFAEAYLGFLVNVGTTMQTTIQKLQSDKVLILELHETMILLKRSLQTKFDQEFYGAIARNIILSSDDSYKIIQFKKQENAFLERTISYLEKWYQYNNNRLENLYCMILKKSQTLSLENFIKIASDFKIDIDEDMLFKEFVKLQYFIQNDLNEEEDIDQRWVAFFKNNSPANNFERLCNTILSIPHSNASSERIFSLMTTAWRKEKNKLDIKTLEAELMIKTNFKMSCKDFILFLKTGNADDILRKVSSCQKYENLN